MTIRNETFTEPTLVENKDSHLTWLRQNALTSTGQGWFAVGYGAFRRLTRTHQIILPSLGQPARLNNFTTQFDEDQPLAAFEQWMLYLDYRILKSNDKQAKRQQELGVAAINQVLPKGVTFDSVTAEGRILFNLGGRKVPTIALSDGYRSMLALTGDLVWRLLLAFPDSEAPLEEEGVVLIDELDIHLHPIWQHEIAVRLQTQFPKLQFFVTGSRFSQQTQATIDRYDALMRKKQRTEAEDQALKEEIIPIIQKAFPFGYEHAPDSLEAKIKNFLSKTLK